ncbi:MAG: hypothetical protein ACFFCU_05970 [Promethearchaeota archaeon]
MPSLFLLVLLLNFIFIGVVISVNGFLLLILIIPWTLFIYTVLCFKSMRFSATNPLYQLAGKLYWISQGTFHATIITIVNILLGALIIPDSSLTQFELNFGSLSYIMVFMLLPFPSFFIFNMKNEDQEHLYDLIYQEMLQKDEAPQFIELTSELLTMTERYSNDYIKQLKKVQNYLYHYIQQEFQLISPFFSQNQAFRLNLENLAIFLTKKMTSLENNF